MTASAERPGRGLVEPVMDRLGQLLRRRRPAPAADGDVEIAVGARRYRITRTFQNRLTTHDRHEPWLDVAYAAALATKPGAIVDVGVNTGQTLMKMLAIDPARRYVGFEPQMDCCFFVDQFIRSNRLHTHTLLPVGLSNRSGVAGLLKRFADTDGTASTVEGFRPESFYVDRQAICVAKGDDLLAPLAAGEIALIKIDVEGGELEVVEGFAGTLSVHSPFVFFEILNHFLIATGQPLDADTIAFREHRNRKIDEVFRTLGYRVFNVVPTNGRVREVAKIEPPVSTDVTITDYVAVHRDYADAFLARIETRRW